MPKGQYGGYKPAKSWNGGKAGFQDDSGLGDGSKVGFQDEGSGGFSSEQAEGGKGDPGGTNNDVER